MMDNPKPCLGFPGMMSSLSIQSQQQKEATQVEPCPEVQGKVQPAVNTGVLGTAAQPNRNQIRTRNDSANFGLQQWGGKLVGPW